MRVMKGVMFSAAALALVFSSCVSAPRGAQAAQALPQPQAQSARPMPAASPTPPPVPPTSLTQTYYRSPELLRLPPSEDEQRVLASANGLMGLPPESKVVVNGRTFVLDCIGTVSAIFYKLDIDVQKDFDKYGGNGVKRLFLSLKDRGALHKDKLPRAGDVIIWDNTWDANGNGDLTDDPCTHAGVVISVDDKGNVCYVHEHVKRGIIVESMNLLRPKDYYDEGGKIINNALALGSGISKANNPAHWTSGDLWDCFGDVLREKEHFKVAGDAGSPSAAAALSCAY
jgi:hypothetical protein